MWTGEKAEHSLAIFWLKKLRKLVARVEFDKVFGRTAGELRESSEFMVDQSFLGWLEQRVIRLR